MSVLIFPLPGVCVMSEIAAIVCVLIYAFKACLITPTYTDTHTAHTLIQWAAKVVLRPPKLHINCSLIVD